MYKVMRSINTVSNLIGYYKIQVVNITARYQTDFHCGAGKSRYKTRKMVDSDLCRFSAAFLKAGCHYHLCCYDTRCLFYFF